MEYAADITVNFCLYVVLGVGLNICLGYGGLFSVVQMGWAAVGAYIFSLLALSHSWPLGLMIGVVAGFAVAAAFGAIVSRLSGETILFATFAFQLMITELLIVLSSWTGGLQGIPGVPQFSLAGRVLETPVEFLVVASPIAMIAFYVGLVIKRSDLGVELIAIREDEIGARSMGISPRAVKATAFGIAGTLGALGGVLSAMYSSFVEPLSFGLDGSVLLLTLVLIGGAGSAWGPVIGSLIINLTPEFLRLLPITDAAMGHARQVLFGGLLIAVLRLRPTGVLGDPWFARPQ